MFNLAGRNPSGPNPTGESARSRRTRRTCREVVDLQPSASFELPLGDLWHGPRIGWLPEYLFVPLHRGVQIVDRDTCQCIHY